MALIHTFTEDFTDLSAWEDISATLGVTGGTFAAVGGKGEFSLPGNGGGSDGVAYSTIVDDYTIADSWLSTEWDTYDSVTSAVLAYTGYQGVFSGADLLQFAIKYDPATDDVSLITLTGTVATFANPNAPITLGQRWNGSDCYFSYSTDSGSSWTEVDVIDYSAIAGISDPIWRPCIVNLAVIYSAYTSTVDNLNSFEPPLPPMTVDLTSTVAEVEYRGDPRVRIILGPILNTDVPAAVVEYEALVPDDILLGVLVDLTSDSATIEYEGIPYDSMTLGPYYVTFLPGSIQYQAIPPLSIDLSEIDPVIDVFPAIWEVKCNPVTPVVGTFVQGDPFYYPWTIIEDGTQDFDMTDMTADDDSGGSLTFMDYPRTQWVRYYTEIPVVLTLTATSDEEFVIVYYEETELDDLTWEFPGDYVKGDAPSFALTDATFSLDLNSGYHYFQLHSDTDDPITLTWTYEPSNPQLLLDIVDESLERAPETLIVALQGADPGEGVRFTWNPPVSDLIPGPTPRPITLATITSDPEGNIYIGSIPIPTVYAGDYLLTATGVSSGKIGTATFIVENDPLPEDSSGSDVEPVASMSIKWLWDDGDGHTWVMDHNPDRMLSVIRSKILTAERTTSGTGQHIIWQGATPAVDWGFSGTVLSQSEFEELEFFYNLNRKFYITTHRNKTYIVTFKSLDVTPRKNGANFWTFDYNASVYLFGEAL